jgi:hypothetical protein
MRGDSPVKFAGASFENDDEDDENDYTGVYTSRKEAVNGKAV